MRAARLRLAALVVTVLAAFLVVLALVARSPEELRRAGDGLGAAGPPVAVLALAALTLALFPFPVSAAAVGLLFGTVEGTPVALAGGVLGASLAFGLARGVAGGTVGDLLGDRLLGLRRYVDERGFVAVLYARVIPGVPRDVANYAFGLTRVRFVAFAAATALGVAPRAFAYTALGGSIGNLGSPESVVAVGLLVALALLGLVLLGRDLRSRRSLAP